MKLAMIGRLGSILITTVFFLYVSTNSMSQARATPLIPTEAFSKSGAERVQLSPDGKRLATLINQDGKTVLVTQDLAQADSPIVAVMSTDNRELQFNWFRWANNERLLVSMYFASKRVHTFGTVTYAQYDTSETRLLSVTHDGKQVLNLIKPRSFVGDFQAQIQDRVVDFLPDDGKHILLQMNDGERNYYPAVFKLNIETGARSEVHGARDYFTSWSVDRDHQVRVGVRRDKADYEIHVSEVGSKNWRKAWSFKALAEDAVWPLGFGKDPNVLYVSADHQGRKAIFTVDLREPDLKRTLKLAHDKFDLDGGLVYSRKKRDYVGVNIDLGDSNDARFWDTEFADSMADINDALPQRANFLSSLSADESRYFVYSSSSIKPPELYLGDRNKNTLKLFAKIYPELDAQQLVTKKSVTIQARDGLKLPGFLSLPLGVEAKKLPTILLVHGGPQSHDDASFDSWAQFLANRGYAVLQVNFRGSTGFGNALRSAGLRRWGLEMQDDLTDAAMWIAKQGIADPQRISIVGASYGGYAALMGAAKTPELFRSAVSFAGVTDLVELGLDENKYIFEQQIGSLDTERERLRATSPVFLADKYKIPLLLIHGTKDRSVPYNQAVMMTKALTDAGNKSFRFVTQEHGDHHLSIYEHRLQFFKELEGFLAQNMTPKADAAAR